MAAVEEVVARIRTGPQGPQVGAIFDFGGTLVEAGSASMLHGETVRQWVGRTDGEILELGEQLFASRIAGTLFHEAWRLVRAHQNCGHTVVIATSATRMQVKPVARELEIDHVLCTQLETDNEVLTGRISGCPLRGDEKLAAVEEFVKRQGIRLEDSYAYASGDDDVPLLNVVGAPHAVNPAPSLAQHAAQRGWPTITFAARRAELHPIAVIRTAAMYGTMVAAAVVGTAAGVLRNDRKRGVDVGTRFFGRVAGSLGNVKVAVTGEQNACSHRPAVFFINHQSTLVDALVTSRVIQDGFTVVAKAEVRDMPVFGKIFDLAGVAFIDRSNTSKAISALEPAADKLRAGTSIVLAPEGTRSFTPKIGQFKKGGFHLAMTTGVPIVPVVIRNAGEIMWRGAKTAREGTIDVVVHQPLPTFGWTKRDIDTWLPRMHQLYIDTLDDWPGCHVGDQWSKAIARTEASSG